jgi:hypothetical protein
MAKRGRVVKAARSVSCRPDGPSSGPLSALAGGHRRCNVRHGVVRWGMAFCGTRRPRQTI